MGNPNETMHAVYELPIVDESQLELVVGGRQKKKRSCVRRFIRAIATLGLLWFVIGAFRRHYGRGFGCNGKKNIMSYAKQVAAENDETIVHCAIDEHGRGDHVFQSADVNELATDTFRHSTTANFTFPTTADALYFVSRGPLSYGFISFEAGELESNAVEVVALLEYNFKHTANVCSINHKDKATGLAVITGQHRRHRHGHGHKDLSQNVRVSITVKLPTNNVKENEPLSIKSLMTNLPMFRHDIKDLQGSVRFDNVLMRSTNFPISVESFDAKRATLTTSNSPIHGRFNVTDSLVLRTQNAPVDVQVDLTNDAANKHEFSSLDISTMNAKLTAEVWTAVHEDAKTNGSFVVHTRTLNAPLAVKFTNQPADSNLRFVGSTVNAPANIVLHPSFEGHITASTSIFAATLEDSGADDPANRGRERTIDMNSVSRGEVSAVVYWGDKGEKPPVGHAAVSSKNAKVTVRV